MLRFINIILIFTISISDLSTQPQRSGVCILACMLVYTSFTLLWYATLPLSDFFFTFWSHPRGRGCVWGQTIWFHGALCSIPLNLICNMTTFRKKLTFWPHPRGRGYPWTKYLLPYCCMLRWLKFDMQHDQNPKKFNFGLGPTPLVYRRVLDPGLYT